MVTGQKCGSGKKLGAKLGVEEDERIPVTEDLLRDD